MSQRREKFLRKIDKIEKIRGNSQIVKKFYNKKEYPGKVIDADET